MNLIAGIGHRKWTYGGFGAARAAMVTAAVVLLVGIQAGHARTVKPLSLGDFFGGGAPRLRGTLHSVKIPLPQPRPPEAPPAETPAADKPPAAP
jgi:hypothetical protein